MQKAGRMKKRVTFQGPLTGGSSDGGGGTTGGTFPDLDTVWASVEPLYGQELYEAQRLNPKLTHHVECRYLAGITARNRIKLGTRIFNILYVSNVDEANDEMHLECEETV